MGLDLEHVPGPFAHEPDRDCAERLASAGSGDAASRPASVRPVDLQAPLTARRSDRQRRSVKERRSAKR